MEKMKNSKDERRIFDRYKRVLLGSIDVSDKDARILLYRFNETVIDFENASFRLEGVLKTCSENDSVSSLVEQSALLEEKLNVDEKFIKIVFAKNREYREKIEEASNSDDLRKILNEYADFNLPTLSECEARVVADEGKVNKFSVSVDKLKSKQSRPRCRRRARDDNSSKQISSKTM